MHEELCIYESAKPCSKRNQNSVDTDNVAESFVMLFTAFWCIRPFGSDFLINIVENAT